MVYFGPMICRRPRSFSLVRPRHYRPHTGSGTSQILVTISLFTHEEDLIHLSVIGARRASHKQVGHPYCAISLG